MGDFYITLSNSVESGLSSFDAAFQESKKSTMKNLAAGAVRVARETMDNATTQWGIARMEGYAGGRSFEPYGKSSGRNDTGQMMNDFGYSIDAGPGYTNLKIGWVDNQEQYYLDQDNGFKNYYRFKGLKASGKPRFGKAKIAVHTPGAGSLEAAYKSARNRFSSAMSAAWNDVVRNYRGTKKPGTYLEARKRYYESLTGGDAF